MDADIFDAEEESPVIDENGDSLKEGMLEIVWKTQVVTS